MAVKQGQSSIESTDSYLRQIDGLTHISPFWRTYPPNDNSKQQQAPEFKDTLTNTNNLTDSRNQSSKIRADGDWQDPSEVEKVRKEITNHIKSYDGQSAKIHYTKAKDLITRATNIEKSMFSSLYTKNIDLYNKSKEKLISLQNECDSIMSKPLIPGQTTASEELRYLKKVAWNILYNLKEKDFKLFSPPTSKNNAD
jgi:hypothetical protein